MLHTHMNTFYIIIAIVKLIKYKVVFLQGSCFLSNFSCLYCLCKFVLYYCGTHAQSFAFHRTLGNPVPSHTVCLDLKEHGHNQYWIIHLIDTSTRYSAARMIKRSEKQTDHQILTRRPNLVIVNKKKENLPNS